MNKYIQALIHTIIFCGIVHIIVRVIYTFSSGQWIMLNAFDILDVDLLVPYASQGQQFFILSWLFIGVIYITMLIQEMGKKTNNKAKKKE